MQIVPVQKANFCGMLISDLFYLPQFEPICPTTPDGLMSELVSASSIDSRSTIQLPWRLLLRALLMLMFAVTCLCSVSNANQWHRYRALGRADTFTEPMGQLMTIQIWSPTNVQSGEVFEELDASATNWELKLNLREVRLQPEQPSHEL